MLKKSLFLLTFAVLLTAGCDPTFHDVTTDAVSNKQIILLKKGTDCYGAFIPTGQHINPGAVKYTWYYREDGKGTFRQSEKTHYKSGTDSKSSDKNIAYFYIEYGPFGFRWTGNMEGKGYIWYSHCEGETVMPDNIRLCVTTETDIEKIDAADPKWVYKGSPSDPGIRANGEKVTK